MCIEAPGTMACARGTYQRTIRALTPLHMFRIPAFLNSKRICYQLENIQPIFLYFAINIIESFIRLLYH